MLGGYIRKQFPQAKCFTSRDYDISLATHENIKTFLKLSGVDVVINAAGIIHQSNPKDYCGNYTFPIILGQHCKDAGAHMIHITTDCVFSGSRGDYTELDTPDANTEYGISKAKGDVALGTIIRTSIIGEELKNKWSLLEWVKTRRGMDVHGYTNQIWNGVTCWQLSKIIKEIISTDNFWEGVRHVYSPTPVSKYQLIKMISDVYGLDVNVKPIEAYTCQRMTLATVYTPVTVPELEVQLGELITVNLEP